MRLLTLFVLAAGTLAAALPAQPEPTNGVDTSGPPKTGDTCGSAWPGYPSNHHIPMKYFFDTCINMAADIKIMVNNNCGICTWFADYKCEGTATAIGGRGIQLIKPSKSFKCVYVDAAEQEHDNGVDPLLAVKREQEQNNGFDTVSPDDQELKEGDYSPPSEDDELDPLCGTADTVPDTPGGSPNYLPMMGPGTKCHNTNHGIQLFLNPDGDCGVCSWWEHDNCVGEPVFRGGAGEHKLPVISKSYKCVLVSAADQDHTNGVDKVLGDELGDDNGVNKMLAKKQEPEDESPELDPWCGTATSVEEDSPLRSYLPMMGPGDKCHNTNEKVDGFSNGNCGYCTWWDQDNCTGNVTYSGGEGEHSNIPVSTSYKCVLTV